MLKSRILTAAVLLAVFLLALFGLPAIGWTLVVAGVIGLAATEWAGLCGLAGAARRIFAAIVAAAVLAVAGLGNAGAGADRGELALLGAAAAFWFAGAPIWLQRWERVRSGKVWLAAGAGALVAAGLAAIRLREDGTGTLLAVLAVAWIADTAAYFSGRAFGRCKLAPTVSPGKTWEGVAGALAAAAAFSALLAGAMAGPMSFAQRWLSITLAVALLVAVSIVGDLFESALKRHAGVKDSGTLLPGHGGVLDRIDSLIAVLPVAALLVIIARRSAEGF
jgi:phosphatidate cytidylyltransferase